MPVGGLDLGSKSWAMGMVSTGKVKHMGWRSSKPVQHEADVEQRFVRLIREHGGLCYKFVSPGNPGVPDRIVILPAGRVLFVELKSSIGRTKKLQHYQIERLSKYGVPTYVLRGTDEVKVFIAEVFREEEK